MHTFFVGKWNMTDAGSWRLRFYDLSGDVPLMNDSTGVGQVTLHGQGRDRKLDLVMPDGGKLTFKHEGPPSPVDLDL